MSEEINGIKQGEYDIKLKMLDSGEMQNIRMTLNDKVSFITLKSLLSQTLGIEVEIIEWTRVR